MLIRPPSGSWGKSSWCTFEAGEKSLSVQMDWHIRLEIEDFLKQWCNWDLWTFPLHVLDGVVPWGHRCSRQTLAGFGHFSHPHSSGGSNWGKVGFLRDLRRISNCRRCGRERDRLVAELAEGEKRMERLREEGRAAPLPKDVVGDEFFDDVAQMRQEILELRRFRDRHPPSVLRGAEGPLVLEIFRQCRRIRTNSRRGS